jgi:AraC-like DNA-binding protein
MNDQARGFLRGYNPRMSRSGGVVVLGPRVAPDGSSMPPYGPALQHLAFTGYGLASRASLWQRHQHAFLELHFFVQGSFRCWVGADLFHMAGGYVLLVPPGAPHGGWLDRMPPGELYWLGLRPLEATPDGSPLGLTEPEVRMIDETLFNRQPRSFRVTRDLAGPFRALVAAYPVRDSVALLAARASLLQILEIVAEASRSPATRALSTRIERSVALIADHMGAPLSVPELANSVGCSPTHFAREFRSQMGISVKDYDVRCRVLAACRELTERDATVTHLAHRLGFASSQHFATAFKRVTGLTPTQYQAACATPLAGEHLIHA